MHVMTIVGTRPEIIKLSRVIPRLDENVDHTLVHTGQNYDHELNEIFFDELKIRRPDYFLDAAGANAASTIAQVIEKSDQLFEDRKPDAVLILGDTNSCLAAISAKRRKIPIFHMEAGNRSFDQRVPEEVNRKIVDHLSDINMTYTEHARRNLLAEGFPADRLFKTGSPQKELLDHYAPLVDKSSVLSRLGLSASQYFVVSLHREENVDSETNLLALVETLNSVADHFKMPLIMSLHPRTKKRLETAKLALDSRVLVLPPFGLPDYVRLQRDSYCTLSDSGTITEESSLLGFPAVTLREAHERPEGVDEGVLVMTGVSAPNVIASIEITRKQFETFGPASIPQDYLSHNLSWKVLKIILSYTEYVNRRVWFK